MRIQQSIMNNNYQIKNNYNEKTNMQTSMVSKSAHCYNPSFSGLDSLMKLFKTQQTPQVKILKDDNFFLAKFLDSKKPWFEVYSSTGELLHKQAENDSIITRETSKKMNDGIVLISKRNGIEPLEIGFTLASGAKKVFCFNGSKNEIDILSFPPQTDELIRTVTQHVTSDLRLKTEAMNSNLGSKLPSINKKDLETLLTITGIPKETIILEMH